MEQNNQSVNTEKTCGCGMCQKMGWCPAGKWHKIFKIVLVVLVAFFLGKMFVGGHGWRDDRTVNTISFNGKGEVVVKPDIATVSFGVTTENLDVAKAQTESATKMNNIIDLLKKKGVDEKDIKTTGYNIYPRYDYVRSSQLYPYGGKQVLAAYVISQTIQVKIRKIADAGAILTGVGEFGVTDVSGLDFTVDNEDEVKNQARDLAIKDAKTQAETLAKELGVKLVKITSFSESQNYPMYYGIGGGKMMESSASVAPSVPAGENTITSNVVITYEIR